jgi:hypothetical protein
MMTEQSCAPHVADSGEPVCKASFPERDQDPLGRTPTGHRAAFFWLGCCVAVALSGCAATPSEKLGEGPYSFHDTRLQYALLIDDRNTLTSEFSMTTEPTLPARIAAGFVLPVSAAAEVASWPLSAAFRAYYESY